ncbi:MAG TPA: amidohydrolase [Thermoanaerobaculia bacterium]|nr:amidohydrolase [Thermoanaerobaculia bacterium]
MRSVLAAALLGGALVSAPAAAADAPLLLTGATVYTSWDAAPRAAAVLALDGKVAFVGDESEARKRAPGATVVALPGAVVYPGFVDAHAHVPGLGMSKESLDLRGRSKEEVLALVRAAAARTPEGEWIRGRSWDQNLWPGKAFPTAAELDAVAPRHPVFLTRVDGHALWVNGLAMERAGVTAATADPEGGKILRAAGGAPSGIFVDNAEALVVRAIGDPTPAARRRYLAAGMKAAAASGLTGVGDASGFDRTGLDVLRAMAREKALPVRLYATVGAETKDLEGLLREGRVAEGRLTVRAVKMYADGALGSRGAALLSDYSDDPGNRGLVLTPPGKMDEIALACAKAGWQLWTHAIGDRGNRLALDAYEKALAAARPNDARFRIEHAQVVAPEEIPRFAKLGVIASMQPTHATSDMPWAEARLGPVRIRGAYAWRSFLAAGVRLAGGSDFPVEAESPLLGLYAAITRQDPSGRPPGGWYPDQRLSRREALRLFTADAAFAEFAETRRGRIAPGFDADLTVLDRDVVSDAVPAAEIPKAKVLLTVVGGEVVFGPAR